MPVKISETGVERSEKHRYSPGMSQNAKIIIEARKAKILADAQAAANELDRDLAELERLSVKYGLVVSSPDAVVSGAEGEISVSRDLSKLPASKATPAAAIAMLRDRNAVQVKDVLEYLQQRKVRIGGKRPLSTLSAYLSADARLSPAAKGWWKLSGETSSKLSLPRAIKISTNGSGKEHGV